MSTATLTWVLPTTRVDNTALASTEIASIAVFDSASVTPAVAIGSVAGAGTSFTTDILTVGDHGLRWWSPIPPVTFPLPPTSPL